MAAPSPSQLPFGRCVEELDTDHGHIATVRLAVAKQPHTSAEQTHFYRWGWLQGEEGQAICWEGQEDTPLSWCVEQDSTYTETREWG